MGRALEPLENMEEELYFQGAVGTPPCGGDGRVLSSPSSLLSSLELSDTKLFDPGIRALHDSAK